MVGNEILLSVPSVDVVDHGTAAALIEEGEGGELIAVRQNFSGALQGRALLIFPHAEGLDLVQTVVDARTPEVDLLGIQQETLAETGNVILTSCLATMANILRQSVTMSLPEVIAGGGTTLLASDAADAEGLVLFSYINSWFATVATVATSPWSWTCHRWQR